MTADVLDTIVHEQIHPQFCIDIPKIREESNENIPVHQIAEENTVPTTNTGHEIHNLPDPGNPTIPILWMIQSLAFQADHPTKPFRILIDGGLNRSVTDDKSLLIIEASSAWR
jgi:hypothetical protein